MTSKLCSWVIVLTVLALVPPLLWLLSGVHTRTHAVDAWLPASSSERILYNRYIDLFGTDDVVLVSWPGCTAEDPRLPEFCREVESLDQQSFFSQIVSGNELLQRLTSKPVSLSNRTAHLRLRGTIVGRDEVTTGAILNLSPAGQSNRQRAVGIIRKAADQCEGLDRDEIRCGGNAYLDVVIDEQTKVSLLFAIPASLLALVIGWTCLRTVRLTLTGFVTAGLAAGFSLALVQISGHKINGLLVLMPALVLVLTMSGSVHLLNYYLKALRTVDNTAAIRQAFKDGWRPCVLATLTTCIGIGSLGISQIFVLRLFGIYSALSLILAAVLLLLFLPAALQLWPVSQKQIDKHRVRLTKDLERYGSSESRYIQNLNKRKTLVFSVLAFLAGFSIVGLGRVETMLRLERFFPESSQVSKDLQWLNEHFIPTDSVQIVVGMSDDSDQWIAKQANNLFQVQRMIAAHDQVDSTFTLQNVIVRIPDGYLFREVLQRTAINDELTATKADLIKQKFFAERDSWRYWRIQVGVKNTGEVDYARLNQELKDLTEQRLTQIEGLGAETEVFVSGISPVFAQAQAQLFDDLVYSFTLAFVLICPAMVLIVGNLRIGLVAMIPNVLPVALVYSLLGWCRIPMDVGTILTASVGLGIAVDDTLHFLEWYGKARREFPDNVAAVTLAFKRCARPMIQTTLICGLGLLAFSPSQFIPVRQFSIVIAILLFAALIADLIILPALLLSPLGKMKNGRQEVASDPQQNEKETDKEKETAQE